LSELNGEKRQWLTVNAYSKFFLGGIDFYDVAEKGVFFPLLNLVANLLAQYSSQPEIVKESWSESAESAGNLFKESFDIKSTHLANFLWYIQWATLGLENLGKFASKFEKTKPKATSLNDKLTNFNCIIGLFQLVVNSYIVGSGGTDDVEDAANIVGCVPPLVGPLAGSEKKNQKKIGRFATVSANFAEGGLRFAMAMKS